MSKSAPNGPAGGAFDRLTCVLCPVGCELEVRKDAAEELQIQGNQCDKGIPFAVE